MSAPSPCAMINTCRDTQAQTACGKFPEYHYKDGVHCVCRECWESLDDDIAAEYEPIVYE